MSDDNIIHFPGAPNPPINLDDLEDEDLDWDENYNKPTPPANAVYGRIVLEGWYDPDKPYDEDHLRMFHITSCHGDTDCGGDFCVKIEWVEKLDD